MTARKLVPCENRDPAFFHRPDRVCAKHDLPPSVLPVSFIMVSADGPPVLTKQDARETTSPLLRRV